MTEPFIPSWAEDALAKPSTFDVALNSALSDFYEQWEHLHNLPNDKMHRRDSEEAAEELVRRAYVIRRMRSAQPINGKNRGS